MLIENLTIYRDTFELCRLMMLYMNDVPRSHVTGIRVATTIRPMPTWICRSSSIPQMEYVTIEEVFDAYYSCRQKKRRKESALRYEMDYALAVAAWWNEKKEHNEKTRRKLMVRMNSYYGMLLHPSAYKVRRKMWFLLQDKKGLVNISMKRINLARI